jgi:hypothetical protein
MTSAEVSNLFNDFATVEQRCHGFLGTHLRLFGLDRLTEFLDSCVAPLIPATWSYATFIKARK